MQSETVLQLDESSIQKAKNVFRAINHPLRQQILELIHRDKKITVTQLYHELQIEQSVASQQLAILRREGIVLTHRDRRFIYYSVNYNRIQEIHFIAERLLV